MKTATKPIEVISYTDNKGNIKPLRFRMQLEDESYQVIKIGRIVSREQERFAGNNIIIFNCQSIINNVEKRYEIKYELGTCKWILFKI